MIRKMFLYTSIVDLNFQGAQMICFMCECPIAPEKGYFKTQLIHGKVMCHVQCQPKFYYDTKPIKDERQKALFPEAWREQK